DSLVFEVLAWTPSTKKAVRGQAFQLVIPTSPAPNNPNFQLPPTQAELTAYFDSVKNQIKGKMVLVGKPATIPVNFNPNPKRLNDDDLRRRFDPNATPQTPNFPQFNLPPDRLTFQ